MKKRNTKRHTAKPPALNLVTSVAIAALIGVLCFFSLLLIFGGICTLMDDPHSLFLPVSLAAIYISSFVSGLSAVICNKRQDRALCSLLGGICFTVILTLILLPFSSGGGTGVHILLRYLGIPLSLLGGFCAPQRSHIKKRRK
jgi:hypothetical protein